MANYNSSYTGTEIDRVVGYGINVSSDIQTQLNNKEATLTKGDLTESTSSVLTLSGNTSAIIGSGLTIQVKEASGSQSGYITSTDWTTFNSKQATITGGATTITTSNLTASRALVSDGSGKVAVSSVTSTVLGYLDATSSIQTQLNSKEPTLSKGNLTETTSSILTIGNGSNSVIGSGTTIAVTQATTSNSGYLSSTDWNTFNSKQNAITGGATTITSSDLTASRALVSNGSGKVAVSGVTSTILEYLDATSSVQTQLNSKEPTVTKGDLTESTSSVLTISGGTGSQIGSGTSLQVKQATTSQSGYLSSTDWNVFNNKQATNVTTDISGTSNQINLSSSGTDAILGSTPITLSLPQDIDTSADVNFANLNLSALTASRALIIDGSKDLTSSVTTSDEISYLNGVTSAVQTQLDSKQKEIYKTVASSGGDYTGLKEAIDDGATKIFIKNGTYLEATPINITNDGTEIIGENIENTVIEFGAGQDGVRVYANSTKIQNLTLDADVNSSAAAYVLGDGQVAGSPDINNGNNNTLDHCIIRGGATTFTIYVAGASYLAGTPTLLAFEANELQHNNKIENCILESTWDGDAFSFSLQKDGSISNNYCVGGRIAYYMNRDTNCVNNSIVDSVNQGIFVGCPAYGNNLNGNRIYNPTSSGIKVQNQLEHTPLLTDQRAFNNNFNENVIYLTGNTGIEVTGDASHEPKGNNFVGNTIFKPDNHGIYIQDAHFNNFNNNAIYQPRTDTATYARGSGFYLVQNVENNNMNDNLIIDERANQLHTAIANREGTDCPNNSVIGNRIIASNSERTVWTQSNGWIISGNYINGGYYAGIYLDGADNCNVVGNICENNTNQANNAYYEIWLNNTADNNIVTNNTCISSAANVANADITVSSGTGNIIENNIGIGTTGEYASILSGLQDMGTGTGVVAQTGDTSFAKRTITGTANQITVANGDGVSANPTLSLPTAVYLGAGQIGRDVNNLIDFSTNNVISFKTNNTASQFVIDASGNIGINTNDIEAWASSYVAIQFPVAALVGGSSTNDLCLTNNAYNDGAMKYRIDGYAQKVELDSSGNIKLQISKESGTANDPVTWWNTLMIDPLGLVSIENKNIGDNAYGLNLTTEIEDSDNASNGIAYFNSGGSYVDTGNTSNNQYGLHVQTYINTNSHNGTLTNMFGVRSLTGITNSGSSGVVTNNIGFDALVYADDGGTITNSYMYRGALYGSTPTAIVNNWGLYLTDEEKNYLSGSLGVGAAPTGNIIGNFQKDQNSATILNVRNDTNDTGALSELQVKYSTQYGSLIQLSPNYTTNGLLTGNSVGVFSNNNSNGLRVFTYDATNLILGTNNTARINIASDGKIDTNGNYFGVLASAPSNFLQVGSMGGTGYTGNQLALGDGTYVGSLNADSNGLTLRSTVGYSFLTNTSTQALLIDSSGDATFSGGLGVGVAPTTNIIGNFQKDQNSGSILRIRNDTSGTISEAGIGVSSGDWTKYGVLNQINTGFSTSGLQVADSVCLRSNGNTNGMRIFTQDATDLTLGTNNTARLTVNSSGNIGVWNTDIETWYVNFKAIESISSSIFFQTGGTNDMIGLLSNAYINASGSDTYKTTNEAVGLIMYDGLFQFKVAPSGTADTAITWNVPLTINNNGTIDTACSLTNVTDDSILVTTTFNSTSSGTRYPSGLYVDTSSSQVDSGVTESGYYRGIVSNARIDNSSFQGSLSHLYGLQANAGFNAAGVGSSIDYSIGVESIIFNQTSNGTVTHSYLYYGEVSGSSGTITNNWGIYLSGCTKSFIDGELDCDSYSVGGTVGADFSGAITNLTVVKGIITAAS